MAGRNTRARATFDFRGSPAAAVATRQLGREYERSEAFRNVKKMPVGAAVLGPDTLAVHQISFQPRSRHRAFTLIEMLVVIGVISILLVAVIPAFTTRKTADEFTASIYTLKGAFEVARTYAQANNTYVWIGFFEETGGAASTTPATPGNGRLVISVVASKDGTKIYSSTPSNIDPTRLQQVGKLVRINNVHVPIFAAGTGTGDKFDTRPLPDWNSFNQYIDSTFGELNAGPGSAPQTDTSYPFQYPVGNPAPTAQYTFKKTMQFSPRGEARINSTFDIRRVVEIGLLPTHQNAVPTPTPAPGNYAGNVGAVQISGLASTVKIYTR